MTATALAPRRTLLPPQSTELERALDQTFPQWDALADAFTVPSVGYSAAASVVSSAGASALG